MKLTDKIIVVTGGSGLLGKAFLKQLAEDGGKVINADVQGEFSEHCEFIKCDVTSEVSIDEMLNTIIKNHRRIDGFINNAYPRTKDWGKHFEEIPFASWQKNVDMQMNSCFLTCQKVLKIMREQKSGSLINISSIYGVVGPDFSVYGDSGMTMPAAYSAIKGGVVNFTRYLASYYGKYNVRVNCISPGGIFDKQNSEFVKLYEEKVPMRRMGLPEDIAPAASFLISDDSKYITGQNLIIDGGWTAI